MNPSPIWKKEVPRRPNTPRIQHASANAVLDTTMGRIRFSSAVDAAELFVLEAEGVAVAVGDAQVHVFEIPPAVTTLASIVGSDTAVVGTADAAPPSTKLTWDTAKLSGATTKLHASASEEDAIRAPELAEAIAWEAATAMKGGGASRRNGLRADDLAALCEHVRASSWEAATKLLKGLKERRFLLTSTAEVAETMRRLIEKRKLGIVKDMCMCARDIAPALLCDVAVRVLDDEKGDAAGAADVVAALLHSGHDASVLETMARALPAASAERMLRIVLELMDHHHSDDDVTALPPLPQVLAWLSALLNAHFVSFSLSASAAELVRRAHTHLRIEIQRTKSLALLAGLLDHVMQAQALPPPFGATSDEAYTVELFSPAE